MTDVQTQVWVHDEPPEPEKVEPIKNSEDSAPNKPIGGLWTSTLRESDGEGVSSGWIEWMKGEHYSMVEEPQAWLLEPEDDVDVYVIDDVWDAKEIMIPDERYRGVSLQEYRIDYAEVFGKRDYDAIHLTREGQMDTRFPNKTYKDGERVRRADDLRPYSLYGWDTECYLWEGWHFTDVEYAGEVTLPELQY